MRQIRQPRRTPQAPGGPLDDPFALPDANMAMITHGPFAETVPIAGLTVGTIRRRFRDRYNLPADGLGMIDGNEVGDDTVVRAGQILTFMHRANAKGMDPDGSTTDSAAPSIGIQGDFASVTWPEGREIRMSLDELVAATQPRWFGDTVWPDGVKIVREMSHGAIVVHQTPSRVHNLQWIAEDSPTDYGKGVKYRGARVALPYVILVAVYRIARSGRLQLSSGNECFFANAPLGSVDDPMCYPALLNVSKMPEPLESRPLAWTCTQYLDRGFEKIEDTGERARRGLRELTRHLLEDGFNRSSEHNEGASWFGETVEAKIDDRLESVRAWEAATVADPMFATEVKWLPTGFTLRQIMARITGYMKLAGTGTMNATALGRIAMNRSRKSAREEVAS
jgi:hypothetical protein